VSVSIWRDGAWHELRYLVKKANGFREVTSMWVRVAGAWKKVDVTGFSVTAVGYNFNVAAAFLAKYQMPVPAGVRLDVVVPAGTTVLGRAPTSGLRAPPAIDFSGVPLNCRARLLVDGQVIGGAGGGGRTQEPFVAEPLQNLPAMVGFQDPHLYLPAASKRAFREANPDPGLVTGRYRTEYSQTRANANAKMRYTVPSAGVDGGDAVFCQCELEIVVGPAGRIAGGGGGGAGIGHGYTKLYHSAVSWWFAEPSNGTAPYTGLAQPDGVISGLVGGQTARPWDDPWYDTQGCKFVSHTIFHGIPGSIGAGGVPLDYPELLPGEPVQDYLRRVTAYLGDAPHAGADSFTSFLPDFATNSAPTFRKPEFTRLAFIANQSCKGQLAGSPTTWPSFPSKAQYLPGLDTASYGVQSELVTTFVYKYVADGGFMSTRSVGYDVPSLWIGKSSGGGVATPLHKTDGTQWGWTYAESENGIGTYGSGPHPMTGVSDNLTVSRRLTVQAGAGGGFAQPGGAVSGSVRALTAVTRNLTVASYTPYGAVYANDPDPRQRNRAAPGQRSRVIDAAADMVKSRMSGTATLVATIADLRDYLVNTVPVSDTNSGPYLGPVTLLPSVPALSVTATQTYTHYRPAYDYWDIYYPNNSYKYSAPAWSQAYSGAGFGLSPGSQKSPGTFMDAELLDPGVASHVFPSVNFEAYGTAFGTPIGAYAGFPVQPCQIGKPGRAGRAVTAKATYDDVTVGNFTITGTGTITGDVG
jgi:hypothetical protein